MLDLAHVRHLACRSKKYWVAALCTASFACGHYLFGADDDESESLLSQYQQATQQLVTEVQPSGVHRQGATTSATPHTSRLQPAKAQAASSATPSQAAASTAPAPQQKSSRRVKPSQQSPTSETAVAKTDSSTQSEPPANTEPVAKVENPATEAPSTPEPSTDSKPALAQHAPPTAPTSEPAPAAAAPENKPLPAVTYVPPQSTLTQKQLAPRMEIITPATAADQSPRIQDPAAQNAPFANNKPAPKQAEVWLPANAVPSQPLPQVINVSRQAVAPPQPPKLATTLAELNDENLPPIVSPNQVPRPSARKKPVQPAGQSTPVLRIDLGKK